MRSLYSASWPNASTLVIFGFHVLLTRHVRALGRKPDKTWLLAHRDITARMQAQVCSSFP